MDKTKLNCQFTADQIELLRNAFSMGAIITPELISYIQEDNTDKKQGATSNDIHSSKSKSLHRTSKEPTSIFTKEDKVVIDPIDGKLLI